MALKSKAELDLARNASRGVRLPSVNSVSRDAVDTSTRHQVFLERVGTETTGRVVRRAQKLEKVAVGVINEAGALGDLGNDDLAAILDEVSTDGMQAMVDSLGELTRTLAELGDYETGYNARELRSFTRGVKIRSLQAKKVMEQVLLNPLAATGELLEDFTQGWVEQEVKAVGNLISKGYTNGWTNQQLIQAIRGTRAANFTDGITARLRHNAESVVRTSVQHVANTARFETWDRNSDVVIGYQIVAVLDGVTTIQCRGLDQLCRDGLVFKLGKGPKPPLHVNCRSTTIPALDPKYDFLKEGAKRSSETGPVDASEGYYAWLKRQDPEFIVEAIGPRRAKLLLDGGLSADDFAKLSLNRNFEPMTLEEMRRKEPLAFKRAGL